VTTPEEQTLQDVCDEVHRRIKEGEVWGRPLNDFVVSQPAVVREAERQARKRRWIDPSISVSDLSHDLLSVAWKRLRHLKVTNAGVCVKEFILFMKQCLWHLPQSQDNLKAEKREAAGAKAVLVGSDEFLASAFDLGLGLGHLSKECERGLLSLVIAACRTLKPPRNEITRLIMDHGMSQKEVAQECGLAESTVSKYVQESIPRLLDLISNWRLGFGEMVDEQ
jgi:hypothetical protein